MSVDINRSFDFFSDIQIEVADSGRPALVIIPYPILSAAIGRGSDDDSKYYQD